MKNSNQTGFVDIHSHILPGLDDGPVNFEQCIDAARCYMDIGVDCVIATPHCIQGTRWTPKPAQVIKVSVETEKKLRKAGIPLRILPGMEIAISDFLGCRFSADQFVSLTGKGVFLIEFPMNISIGTPSEQGIKKFLSGTEGLQFIIAHPERCAMFHDNIDLVGSLVEDGMLVQVNTGSIFGLHGRKVQKTALQLFRNGLVHFLATDSHARDDRMPPGPRQMTQLARILGEQTLQAVFRDNPRRLIDGRRIHTLAANRELLDPRSPGKFMQRFRRLFQENLME